MHADLPQITGLCSVTYCTARAVQPGYSPSCISPIESGRKGTLDHPKQKPSPQKASIKPLRVKEIRLSLFLLHYPLSVSQWSS